MNATALRQTARWRDVTRVSAVRVAATVAVSLTTLTAIPAFAQAPAWPSDAPKQAPAAGPAWPTDNRSQAAAPAPSGFGSPAAPGGFGSPAAPGGFGPPTGGGFGPPRPTGPGPNPAAMQACNDEFAKMRAEADKRGAVAKSISEKHGSPVEFCKAITSLHSTMASWWKYAKSQVSTCGVPEQVVKQLNEQQIQLAKVKSQVCNAAANGAAAPRAPSLSEALGATSLPSQNNTTVKRGGTLDTLTGNPIR